jgi:hypothetical protein
MRNPATQQQPTMVTLAGKHTMGGTYNRKGVISIRREIVLDIMYRHYHSYQDAQPEAARLQPQVRTTAAQLQASGHS